MQPETTEVEEYAASRPILVKITVENLAPANGTLLAPIWFGFHDGSFSIYEPGSPASPALERLAEDGNTGHLTNEFVSADAGLVQGTLFGSADLFNDTGPGSKTSMNVFLAGHRRRNRYFSYAAMIIPSNDAFISNGDPRAHRVFDDTGAFIGADFVVEGSDVLDAGTEVNDEDPFHAAGTGPIIPGVGPLLIPGAGLTESGSRP